MVRGLGTFKKYFEGFPDNYIIIGGTACDLIINEAGFTPRVTRDIDIILVVEALSADFVKQFWKFIQDGHYERKEKSDDKRKYYRFIKPQQAEFPFQIELFARNPDLIDLDEDAHLTPIPLDDDLTSLSAILLNDDYYNYLLKNSVLKNSLNRSRTEALICLKAKAYLEIANRISTGSKESSKKLSKHKGDVFRLAVMLAEDDVFELPLNIKADMQAFAAAIAEDLPATSIFKDMGLSSISVEKIYNQILKIFQLNGK